MKFQPKSEKEIREEMLFEPGVYDFEVLSSIDTTSKTSGNPMLKLRLAVFVGGKTRYVNDNIVEAMAFKLRHFAETIGLLDRYEAGALAAHDCEGRSGKVHIIIQEANGNFEAKNAVKDYIVPDQERLLAPSGALKTAEAPLSFSDDDLPF